MSIFRVKYLSFFFLLISFFSFLNILYSYYFNLYLNLNTYYFSLGLSAIIGLVFYKFKSNENRVKNSAEVNSIVASWIKKYEQEEVLKIFERAGITAAPIYDISDIMVDPHIRDRETIIEIEDNDLGHAMHHNIFPKLSLTKGKFRRPAPNLGEHSNEILREAGFSKQQITQLCEQGVINKRI